MKSLLLTATILASAFAHAQYTLVWADEFDGTSLNLNTWTHEIGGGGWGNNESQFYTPNPGNSNVANGVLTITALQQSVGSNPYTSARIISKDKQIVKHGKIEARLKVPMGQGLWPAFWMLGNNISSVGWPSCGEIDIMEHVNSEYLTHGTAHWNNGGHVYQGTPVSNNSPNEFHTYAIVWDATKIQWLLDGNIYFGLNIANGVNGTSEFQGDFFLILNLAVGGNWPGYPNASTVFPAEYVIDYVRIYKDESELGLSEDILSQVSISPNPVSELLNLNNLTDDIVGEFQILNTEGSLCLQNTLDQISKNQIDVATLHKGMYFLRITSNSGQDKYFKFIKE
jgi:beta-glucanase (GH16 family)